MKLSDVITLAEAAEELGIAPVTLRAQAAAGRFEARNLPGLGWITTMQAVEVYRRDRLGKVGRPGGSVSAMPRPAGTVEADHEPDPSDVT